MAQQLIGLGTTPNDGTGDTLRIAGDKINDNFDELYSKIASDEFVIIRAMSDFPTPVGNLITLGPNITYFLIRSIDTLGKRFQLLSGSVIAGSSSVNAGIYSSVPLDGAMFTSADTVDMKNISVQSGSVAAFAFDGTSGFENFFINNCTFIDCSTLGTVKDYSSVIFDSCTFSNCGRLNFDGTIGTYGVNNVLGIPSTTEPLFKILSTCTISRRIRVTLSSFIVDGTANAFDVSTSATIPDEAYIIKDCNFSGASANYLTGVSSTSNKALFAGNKGITNTIVLGQAYMQGNATATTISVAGTFVKAAGTTIAGELSKYLHSSNRLTCDAIIERKFLVQGVVTFTSSNNQNIEFGFYDSTIAGVRTASRITQNTGGAGIAQSIPINDIINHNQGDYLELHVTNNTSTASVTVVSINLMISQI